MKRFLSVIMMLICILSSNAQTVIKGTLVDSLSHEGEPYATIRIYKQKHADKPVAMAVTDLDGHFSPSVTSRGNYVISFSSVGRMTITRNFTVSGQKEIDLGTILTRDDATTLGAVEVVAQKPIVKMEADKMTYSVEDDTESKTLTVLDMLRKVPMVTVDGQDNITVNGSSSFKVYTDGKPNAMLTANASTILKTMPASMVKSIEVVTNPGAKYDAEGAGGILDIKMVNRTSTAAGGNLNGYNGTVTANGGNNGYGAGVFLAGQQGKFTYNVNANMHHVDNGNVVMNMERKQSDGSTMEYSQDTKNSMPIILGSLAIGYEIDSLSSVNASFGFNRFSMENTGNPTTRLYGGVYGNGFSYDGSSETETSKTSFNGSLDYRRYLNADRSSSLTLTYQLNTAPGKNDTRNSYEIPESMSQLVDLTDRASIGRTNTVENIAQVDLVTKLSGVSTLSSGLKYTNRRGTSDMDYYLGDKYQESLSLDYSNTDQIGAIYAELDNHWQNWSLKPGLRYEQTWQKVRYNQGNGEDFSKHYGNLVPSASLSRTLKPGMNIGLTYNMRISRPGITYLNPYIDRSDPTAISYGNSELTVEKTHNVSLVFNSYSQRLMWNATLRQQFGNGGIEEYSFFDGNIMNTTYGNIVDRRVTSLDIFLSWLMTKNTRVTFKGSGSYNDFRSAELGQNTYGWMANGMLSVQQKLPKDWNVNATILASTDKLTLQGSTSGFNMGMLSVSKSLFKDRLSIGVIGVTGLSKGGKLHLDQYSQGSNFSNSTKIEIPVARIMANVTFRFGNTKKQYKKTDSQIGSDYIEHTSVSESIGNVGNMQNQ